MRSDNLSLLITFMMRQTREKLHQVVTAFTKVQRAAHSSRIRPQISQVSSTAFEAHPPDLPPVSLMDMGFAIIRSLARHRRPRIRFLFIGSHLCSARFFPAPPRGECDFTVALYHFTSITL